MFVRVDNLLTEKTAVSSSIYPLALCNAVSARFPMVLCHAGIASRRGKLLLPLVHSTLGLLPETNN